MSYVKNLAAAIRILSVDMIEKAKSGHPGMPLGMADVAAVLWAKFLRIDPTCPAWFNRDRFILSNGHGSALLYSLLYLFGFEDVDLNALQSFRQLGSKTAGHPEKTLVNGIDFSTGPLGQGLAGGVGMALAERLLNAEFGDALVHHKTYVFAGDGCLMEGISEEAVALAGHWKLNQLIVLWDDNHITIDGPTDIASSTDMKKRFEANNWLVLKCDGHSHSSIEKALTQAQTSDKPVLIDCKTTIGFGAPTKAGTPKCHGSPLGADEIAGLRQKLNWTSAPFEIPQALLTAIRAQAKQWEKTRREWEKQVEKSPYRQEFIKRLTQEIPACLSTVFKQYKEAVIHQKEALATRKSSQNIINLLAEKMPSLVCGSADLAGASYTKPETAVAVTKDNYAGRYIHYGIREHAMGGIMNGLAAHGGLIPLAGTFLSFVDYMKPAIRLACLMELQEIYVLTHDSIGVGEDGPTHQPIEQLVSLRATPNLLVLRPADSVETAECYETALAHQKTPSAIICSRQALPLLRENINENLSAKGGYVLKETPERRNVTLIATGSEVSLACRAAVLLEKENIAAAVVSMPCRELFELQSASYREAVLGTAPRLVIEAASSLGWDRFIGETGAILSVDGFGASGKGDDLFKHFGFTPENVVQIVKNLLL